MDNDQQSQIQFKEDTKYCAIDNDNEEQLEEELSNHSDDNSLSDPENNEGCINKL